MLCVPADPCSLDNLQKIILTFVITIELKSVVNPTSRFWKKAWVRTSRRADSKATSSELSQQGRWPMRGRLQKIHRATSPTMAKCLLPFGATKKTPLSTAVTVWLHLLELSSCMKRSPGSQSMKGVSSIPPMKTKKKRKRKKYSFFWKSLYTKVPIGQFWLVFWAIYMDLYSPLFFWEGD